MEELCFPSYWVKQDINIFSITNSRRFACLADTIAHFRLRYVSRACTEVLHIDVKSEKEDGKKCCTANCICGGVDMIGVFGRAEMHSKKEQDWVDY